MVVCCSVGKLLGVLICNVIVVFVCWVLWCVVRFVWFVGVIGFV